MLAIPNNATGISREMTPGEIIRFCQTIRRVFRLKAPLKGNKLIVKIIIAQGREFKTERAFFSGGHGERASRVYRLISLLGFPGLDVGRLQAMTDRSIQGKAEGDTKTASGAEESSRIRTCRYCHVTQ